jgi:hypothetical protein
MWLKIKFSEKKNRNIVHMVSITTHKSGVDYLTAQPIQIFSIHITGS